MELISCCIDDGIHYMISFSCCLIAAIQGGENASEGNISDITIKIILRFSNTKRLGLALWVDRQIRAGDNYRGLIAGNCTLR
jgi:hypothetical protein